MTYKEQWKARMISKYGTYEKYLEQARQSGSKGGKMTTKHGFSDIPGLAVRAAKKKWSEKEKKS